MTRPIVIVFLSLFLVCLAGCQEEEPIRKYQAARINEKDAPQDTTKMRLLAALVFRDDVTWSFKLLGLRSEIDAHASAFDRFIGSVQFQKDAKIPISWTAPTGWRAQAGSGLGRYATFQLGTQLHPLELRVNRLTGGNLLANINRWRGQDLGLADIAEEDLGKVTRRLDVHGVPFTRVDMTGPGSRRAAMGL